MIINRKSHIFDLFVHFFARGLHTRTAVARLPLCQLDFLVGYMKATRSVVVPVHKICIAIKLRPRGAE